MTEPKTYDPRIRALIDDIQKAESAAHALGLTLAGQALNRAKNVAGWQFSGDNEAAAQALAGVHPTDTEGNDG